MRSPSLETAAKIGITIQFLALTRSLAEYFRVKYVAGTPPARAFTEALILGCLIAGLFTWAAVGCFFFGRFRATIIIAAASIATLVAYKIVAF
jgi:hypothetical protein